MKRKPCVKNEKGETLMTKENLKISLHNQQDAFETLELNESLHLQYYGFSNIDNLDPFTHLHTLYLNNNVITEIANLDSLTQLRTLNLSFNCIKQLKNVNSLSHLYSLDLSNNQIEEVKEAELAGLKNINNLKLVQNQFKRYQNIKDILAVADSLTYLDLSSNECLEYDVRMYSDFLPKMKVTVLSLQGTLIPKNVPSYRKETITVTKSLKYLDDRPVTEDERMLAEAWKKGGLLLQKQLRSKIRQKLIDKNTKIYTQIQQRNKEIEQKRSRVLSKLTNNQNKTLQELIQKMKSEDYELMAQQQKKIMKLKVEDLHRYLELMVQNVKDCDLQKELNQGKVQLPSMIIDRETPEAIFVYNVKQEQIPIIVQKYYQNQTRPVIAVNHQNPAESRWIPEYDQLLHTTYDQVRGNFDMLVPIFNLGLYELDLILHRKIKRFELEELKHHLKSIREEENQRQRSIDVLNELD